ncbi:DUF3179 domain-containing protein [Acidobacteriota bacterium]
MNRIRVVMFVLGITFMIGLLHMSLVAAHFAVGENSFSIGQQTHITPDIMRRFRGFKTNLRKHSINLNLVRDGGPGKDEIPPIHNPQFVSIDVAMTKIREMGVFVDIKGERRFYPYNILVWHEIVNDSIQGEYLAVTFCPLCGSAIVFDRKVGGQILRFGVSGKLYESNLLMYDDQTESLWSQSMGEAVVGDYTGSKLQLVRMQWLSFDEVKSKYPDTVVLSENTGYLRDYTRQPYLGYEKSEDLYFSVRIQDKRFFAKEMMYVFKVEGQSVAFPVRHLSEAKETKTIKGKSVTAERVGGEINVIVEGKLVPGYYEMWFSWATQHQKEGFVWELKD